MVDNLDVRPSSRPVRRYHEGRFEELALPLTAEAPLTIFYNGREIITLLTTPDHPEELAVGFLRSEGFLNVLADLAAVTVEPEGGMVRVEGKTDAALVGKLMEKRTITSGCGKGTTFYSAHDALAITPGGDDWGLAMSRLLELVAAVNHDILRARTAGGVHHAALVGGEGLRVLREDIGRHNAIDKIQGHCFLHGLHSGDAFLLTTGRITSEILIKAGKLGVPVIVAFARPTDLALDLAERLRISVVGGAHRHQATIYLDFGRLT